MKRRDAITAVVDVLPVLPMPFEYAVTGGRVRARCTACGVGLDVVGRPSGFIGQWALAHLEQAHAEDMP